MFFRLVLLLSFIPSLLLSQNELSDTELYGLEKGVQLDDLPIDTALRKIASHIYILTGERGKVIKEDMWELLSRSKAANDPTQIAKSHGLLAYWHYAHPSSSNPDSTYFHQKKSLDYYLQTDNYEKISKGYEKVGLALIPLKQYDEAEQSLYKGLAIAEDHGLEENIHSLYTIFGVLYKETEEYELAAEFGEKVVAAYKIAGEEYRHPLIRALVGLSRSYNQLGQHEQALALVNEAFERIDQLPAANQEGERYLVRGRRSEVYLALEAYEKALEDGLYSLNGYEKLFGIGAVDNRKGTIGTIYQALGACDKAIPYFKAYIRHAASNKIVEIDEFIHQNKGLATCYLETNQPDSAFMYLQKGHALEVDQLQEELKAIKNELRVKYDTEQKEATIATQSSQLQQQRQIQYLSYAVGGLLLLLLIGLFLTYQNNQKRNILLEGINEDLEATNAQNELLLREIHHRVKNNLETISSLLELQSAQVEDDEAQSVMQASQNRVQAMSIIHQKLYQDENLASIEMKYYFKNLVENILHTYDAWERVKIEYDMSEIELDVDTAVPIGLIVNELLTNALKYAFPDGKKGKVYLSLEQIAPKGLQLVVADNGVGKTTTATPKGTGFGSQLIALLTRQLNGTMRKKTENGMSVVFEFKSVHRTDR